MAIEELTQLHDLYFGRYKQNEKQAPLEKGRATQGRRAEEPAKLPQKKPKFEVQPPQIIYKHQPANSMNVPTKPEQPQPSLNVLLADNGNFLSRTNGNLFGPKQEQPPSELLDEAQSRNRNQQLCQIPNEYRSAGSRI